MNMEAFHNWLLQQFTEKTVSSRMSNCRKIEEFEGSLDEQYHNDKGKKLIDRLSYSSEDERERKPPKHNIPINGNVYNGTATYKQAANLYFQFKKAPSSSQQPIKPAQSFSDMAKELAKQIVGSDAEFSKFIDQADFERYFDREIKIKLYRFLQGLIGEKGKDMTLYDLIDTAYKRNLLTKEKKAFADTIRIYRNIIEYENIDENLEKCCNLIVLFAYSGLWRCLKGSIET